MRRGRTCCWGPLLLSARLGAYRARRHRLFKGLPGDLPVVQLDEAVGAVKVAVVVRNHQYGLPELTELRKQLCIEDFLE